MAIVYDGPPSGPMMRCMSLAMNRMVGNDFAAGLANRKALVAG